MTYGAWRRISPPPVGRPLPPANPSTEQRPRAFHHQLRLLVDDEVAGVGDSLEAHVIGEALEAREEPGADVEVALAEQEQGRRLKPVLAPVSGDPLRERPHVVAVERAHGTGALRRA